MAENSIFLKIKSMFDGDGFRQLQKDANETARTATLISGSLNSVVSAAKKMDGDLGDALQKSSTGFSLLSDHVKGVLKALGNGSAWAVAAAGISGLIKIATEFGGTLADWVRGTKEAERETNKLIHTYDEFLTKAKSATSDIADGYNKINSAIDLTLRRRKDEISTTTQIAQAEAELARQRDIANGGDGKSAALAAKEAELNATRNLLAAEREAAELRKAEAQKTLDAAREQLVQLDGKRAALQSVIDVERETTAEMARRGNILDKLANTFRSYVGEVNAGADRAKVALEKMAEGEKFKKMNSQIDELNKLIEQTKATVDKATQAIEAEGATLERIADKETTLTTKVAAERLRTANEVAQEEAKLREQQLAEEEKLRNDVTKRITDALKEAADEREQIEKDTLEKKKEMLEEAFQAEVKNMDKLLAEARGKMGEWEKEAQKARGKGFDEWLKEEQKRKNEQGKQDRRMQKEKERVDKQIKQLEERERKGMLSKQEQERLDTLRKWRAAQDPKNNPFLDEIKNLALRRDGLIRATKDEISAIKEQLKNLGLK